LTRVTIDRRRTFYLLLKDECHTSQEIDFVKEWFRTVYLRAEERAAELWLKYRHRFALKIDENTKVRIDDRQELIEFNSVLERIWYKYHYNVIRMISKKFRPRKEFKILDEQDPFFENLPESCTFNVNEHSFFEDYVYSDLMIETLRAAKLKSITDHVSEPDVKHQLLESAVESFLDHDEVECYNNLLMDVQLDQRWGSAQDAEYEKRMQ